jgi:hypothetical protein
VYSVAALGKYWSIAWRFFIAMAAIFGIVNQIKIPTLVCRTPVVREVFMEIVDMGEQIEEIDRHLSRIQFLGPRNEVIPESLNLHEWEEMEYVEPDFVIL